jgi:hypothetical protein
MSETREMAEVVVHILRPGTKSAAWGVYDPYLCGLPNRPRPGIDDNWVYSSEGCATCPECIRVFHADDNPDSGADPALLALARFGALVVEDHLSPTGGFTHARFEALDRAGLVAGVIVPGGETGPVAAHDVRDAIAALLAPDGAASEGVTP